MAIYANRSRFTGPRLRKGDLVYLLRRNIKIIRLNDKLDLKKIGLFKIKRNIKNISFEFHLSPIIRIYLIFYISLLEPADLNILKKISAKAGSRNRRTRI
jgi:hypothetical protein